MLAQFRQLVSASFAAVPPAVTAVHWLLKSGLRSRFTTALRSFDTCDGLFSMPLSNFVNCANPRSSRTQVTLPASLNW